MTRVFVLGGRPRLSVGVDVLHLSRDCWFLMHWSWLRLSLACLAIATAAAAAAA